MATKSLVSKTSFIALIFLFLIVAASEMRVAEANKYCWKKSHKWSGACLDGYKCSHHCKHLGYKYGLCHKQRLGHWGSHWKYSCICYYHC